MRIRLLMIAALLGMLFVACTGGAVEDMGIIADQDLVVHDSIYVKDTININDTVNVKDTIVVEKNKKDTVFVEKNKKDTVFVEKGKKDTVFVEKNKKDTVYIEKAKKDTVYIEKQEDDSTGTSSQDSSVLANYIKLTGVAQKGPFEKGSKVTVSELVGNGSLEPTGVSFSSIVLDNDGNFAVDTYALKDKLILVSVNGRYVDEYKGDAMGDTVTLYSLNDLSGGCTSANVNLFTHLVYARIKNILETQPDKKYQDAKNIAEREILLIYGVKANESPCTEALDVFGKTPADAALLSASIMMGIAASEGGLSDSLQKFTEDFADNGKLDGSNTQGMLSSIYSRLKSMDLDNHFEDILKNMKSISKGKVNSDFLVFLRGAWYTYFKFPACGYNNVPVGSVYEWTRNGVVPLTNEHSGDRYTCVDSSDVTVGKVWRRSELIDYDTVGIVASEGDWVSGKYESKAKYVLDNGTFRPANEIENYLNRGCVAAKEGESTSYGPSSFKCEKGNWIFDKVKSKGDSVVDVRDTSVYGTMAIGSYIWMTENLKYNKGDSLNCYNAKKENCQKYGALFKVSAIVENTGDIYKAKERVKGVCPSGWHIATSMEFENLVNFAKSFDSGNEDLLTSLKSTSGWNASTGTDLYGFNAVPAGEGKFTSQVTYSEMGNSAKFWEQNVLENNGDIAFGTMEILKDSYNSLKVSSDTTKMYSVRCVKDHE